MLWPSILFEDVGYVAAELPTTKTKDLTCA